MWKNANSLKIATHVTIDFTFIEDFYTENIFAILEQNYD